MYGKIWRMSTLFGRSRRVQQLASADLSLIARNARIRPSGLDRTMVNLSRSANHSALWVAVSALLIGVGGRPRRAAVRGLLAVFGSSVVANGLLKPAFPRRRPPADAMPVLRRLVRPPSSSSFPSGHAASAAAFVTALALESPASAAIVAPLAGAVAYSRVHVGVHWPSDVLAGAGVGIGVAVATRRWWAVRPDQSAKLGPEVRTASLPDGHGLLLLVNPASGSADEDPSAELRELLPAVRVIETEERGDVITQLNEAIDEYAPRALGVCGGDGTVQAAAQVAIQRGLALAVLPGGTLNHFARDAGVVDVADTAKAVLEGHAAVLDTAEVTIDGGTRTLFLNTASIGGYPDTVRLREKLEHKLGKWPAAALAMSRVLQHAAPLEVTVDGNTTSVWMIFVGNGRYAPTDQVPMSRPTISEGTIDVRYLRADTRASRARLLWAAATGTLGSSATYVQRSVSELTVQVLGGPTSLAADGEVVGRGRRFEFRSSPQSLTLYAPAGELQS